MKPNKIYRLAKIERHNDVLTDLEGNFNLMRASPRALRLLDYLLAKKTYVPTYIEIAPFPPQKPLPWYTAWIPNTFGPMRLEFTVDITWCMAHFKIIIPWLFRLEVNRTSSTESPRWWWRLGFFDNPKWRFGNL